MTYLIEYVLEIKQNVSCECKCRFGERNVIQINGEIMINTAVNVKNVMYVEKDYV